MMEYKGAAQNGVNDKEGFSVRVLGIGGAGANALDRIALEGMDGAELVAMNTDIRALTTSVSSTKIQLGAELTLDHETPTTAALRRLRVSPCSERCSLLSLGRVTRTSLPSVSTDMSRWMFTCISPSGPFAVKTPASIFAVTASGTRLIRLPSTRPIPGRTPEMLAATTYRYPANRGALSEIDHRLGAIVADWV